MSRVLALLAILAVAFLGLASATKCLDVKDRAECNETAQGPDAGDKCVWCNAKAVPSVCVDTNQAQKLPAGVFICDGMAQPEKDARLRYLF
jgi:hypothetical protein